MGSNGSERWLEIEKVGLDEGGPCTMAQPMKAHNGLLHSLFFQSIIGIKPIFDPQKSKHIFIILIY